MIWFPFNLIKTIAVWLFKGYALRREEGAKFAKASQYKKYLNQTNTGLILNGDDLALSEKDSYQNVCVIARVGAGKTSRYIIPNVLARAKRKCSIVVNDPKGEVFEATSAILESRGFRLVVVSPEEPEYSAGFNPLAEARNDIELDQIAEIIVKAGNPSTKDEFWNQGAIRFVSLFLRCLRIAEEEEKGVNNLANLYYLLQNFGTDGSPLDNWVAKYSVLPEEPDNPVLWNEWKGLLTGNKEGIQSFVLNALTALKALSNRSIAQVTARSDFALDRIRQEKTALFFITPPQLAEYYGFLTSVFFRSVFNASMRQRPGRGTLPLYVFYDEFGHSTIPNFVSTANTIRAYQVSLSIVLQSISQLSSKYGRDGGEVVKGGFATYISYAGSDPETTRFFELICGRRRITQLPNNLEHYTEHYREENLINSAEIRMMKDDEVLIVSANRPPIKLTTTPYFEHFTYRRQARRPPVVLTSRPLQALRYTKL